MRPTTAIQAINSGAARLAGVTDTPRLEARLLLAHSQGLTQNDLIRHPDRPIDATRYETALNRRIAREPLALIVGHREFWSLDFRVSPATLIPRPDSETLIEAALAHFAGRRAPATVLDLGTGTGCLLLALLSEFPSAFGVGLDRSPAAAALARTNATQMGLADRAAFLAANWAVSLRGQFDLVISNPPYIRSADIPLLMPEVANYEPRSALDGGVDGYDAYREIMRDLPSYLSSNGVAVLELGQGQATLVADLARDSGLSASLRHDLAGIPRAMVLTPPNQ